MDRTADRFYYIIKNETLRTGRLQIYKLPTPNAKVIGTASSSAKTDLEEDNLDDVFYFDEYKVNVRDKKNVKMWDHWSKWSPCSVTCGVGKMTRWRHCVSPGCDPGEKEAQIKTCTLAPCQ
ncbi:hypothetical protein NQ318_009024 [Aromia moschata]|uniref:Uncharacterized protein n=1 Tax=Aromia moschata TaxID=1265417 RepID=A0AAV8YTZ9_9CUCU|nr:hypothetical protein NQ318_009024 [Aromia moschata]